MTEEEAYLMARMQIGLVCEGVLHHPPVGADETWLRQDKVIILRAVKLAWPRLDAQDRSMLRHWAPGTTGA